MQTRGGKRSKRRTKKSGKRVGGLKQHLKHLDHNKALVNKLKSAAKGKSSTGVLKKVSIQLKRLAKHASKAASAASKGATKLKRAALGKTMKRRRSKKRRRSRRR